MTLQFTYVTLVILFVSANSVELCDSLSEGGTTPSFGAIAGAVEAASKSSTKVNVLIRPRARDFCYTSREVQAMVRDIAVARMLGADGVVVGALTPSGGIDFETLSAFVRAAKEPLNAESLLEVSFASTSCSSKDGKEGAWPTSISPETLPQINVTFHRAFDVLRLEVGASREGSACTAPSDAIDVDILLSALANAGVDRLLTSGMAPSAWEGRQFIRRLQVKFKLNKSSQLDSKMIQNCMLSSGVSLTSPVLFDLSVLLFVNVRLGQISVC